MVLNFGVRCILLLLIACFIAFYVRRALQQKQHRRIIYRMCCRSVLSENSGQISIQNSNIKSMQIQFQLESFKPKFENSNFV